MTLILASASAVRLSLLKGAGLSVAAKPAAIDEAAIKAAARAEAADVADTALLLAEMKARRVARAAPAALVIGADQILVQGSEWFDKPADLATAAKQLRRLAGVWHELVTAIVCWRGDAVLWRHVARPRLRMRPLSEAALAAYLAAEGERVLSSVGAYRLEGPGIQLFEAIEGEYFSILGLPLLPLLGFLRQHFGCEWLSATTGEETSFTPP
ncbi:MAG: Maf family protein [Acidibrevibacterium sp.]|uniref:Maf family protein n=1 Tax=Acidibrevibacterium fodinaquatile TaxID=1969806 RepID=UPI000E0D5785|nr:Maf family protein [Acidibrevibacterium fodinaquatile]MCA7121188.1 Maf family protein [Acidibrevibacterium fodinaquatile]